MIELPEDEPLARASILVDGRDGISLVRGESKVLRLSDDVRSVIPRFGQRDGTALPFAEIKDGDRFQVRFGSWTPLAIGLSATLIAGGLSQIPAFQDLGLLLIFIVLAIWIYPSVSDRYGFRLEPVR